jgi:hypothetical protein
MNMSGAMPTLTAPKTSSPSSSGLTGVYHHVSEQHLRRYLAEFDSRHNNRSKLGVEDEDIERADRALLGVKGKGLIYTTSHNA